MSEFKTLQDLLRVDADHRLESLKQHFPEQFGQLERGSWPPGWHLLMLQTCVTAALQRFHVRWLSIKEKWGGLRLSASTTIVLPSMGPKDPSDRLRLALSQETFREQLAEIREISHRTCANCARHGTRVQVSGWVIALCPHCAKAFSANPWHPIP